MNLQDLHGHALSGATPGAIDAYERGTQQLRCYVGDPLADAQDALRQAPEMTMAHALVGWLNLLGTEPAGLDAARAALQAASMLSADEREAMHLKAIGELVDGRWHAASRTLEDLTIRWPNDLLALQAGHQIDFFTGHSRMLRDRIARALPAWREGMPGWHAVLGMHAFGLEETGDYAQAEARGRRAAELEPRDGWAWHAVAHVLEMQDRRRDGIGWLRQDITAWSEDSFFAVHNWWHLALFHLGLGEIDEVLALADARIVGPGSAVLLDMLDGSALLWRLHLRGIDVGTRWQALAERWAPLAEAGNYAFNDMHAMMAFVGAGRDDDARRLRAAQARAEAAVGDNSGFLRDVGLAATAAIEAFGHGRYGEAVELLRPIRSHAHRFGGSHAQRDLIDLTLIEAAARDGQRLLADALLQERRARGIASPLAAAAPRGPGAAAPIRLRKVSLAGGPALEVAEAGPPGGLPMLLLHGGTDSWRSFETLLPLLPRHWHVVAPSQRGHGDSDKPMHGYRTRDFAADAAQLIEALGLAPAIVVGHSMGAANAMRLAIDRPQLVRGLVGIGAFARFGDKPELADFVRTSIAPLADPVPHALADEFQRGTLARPVDEAFVQAMVAQSLKLPAHVWRQLFAALLEDDFADEVGRIEAPTLLLRGAADVYVKAGDTAALLRAIRGARETTWAGYGHAPHWEEPVMVAQVLAGFVASLQAAPA